MADSDQYTSNTPRDVVDGKLMDKNTAELVDLLCHLSKTPTVLYGMFLEVIRQFYSSNDNLPIEVPSGVIWHPNPEESRLWINTELEWEEDAAEFRPAIYIGLSNITYKSTTGRHDSAMGMDLEQGEYHFSREGSGTVSFNHVGSTKSESVALAGATLDFMGGFCSVIRDMFKFETLELASMSPIQLDKESRERYRSVVAINFMFQDTWTLKLESPKLKRLVSRIGQTLIGADAV